jgi:hypothetical protein
LRVIDLPQRRWEPALAVALTLAFAVAAAFSPVDPSWRAVAVVATLVLGSLSYHGYRRRRPSAVETSPDGSLVFRFADSRCAIVESVRIGVASPLLLAARCRFADGTLGDLFVPGASLAPGDHWALRRAVVGFSGTHARRGR